MGCGGGALGAPLWVALLMLRSGDQRMEWNGMICLLVIVPLGPTLSLISRDRSGIWRFGGISLWSTSTRV
jgi:hypothetical protein